jgi:tetratricopeptide (TPR) repeat protein
MRPHAHTTAACSRSWPSRLIAGLLGVALLVGCSPSPEVAKRQALDRGTRYLAQGKPNEAVVELRTALQVDPTFFPALHALGRAYMAKAWYADALRELTRALKVDPSSVPVRIDLGRVWLALEGWEDARAQGTVVQERAPTDPHGPYLVGAALGGKGDTKNAIPLLERARDAGLGTPDVSQALGDTLAKAGRWEESEAAYRAALARDPRHVASLVGLGTLLFRRQRLPEADEVLERAMQLQRDNASVRLARSALRSVQGREDEAIAELDSLPAQAWSPRFELLLGEVNVRRERYEEAVTVLTRLTQSFPHLTPAHYWLGLAALGSGRVERAVDEFRIVIKQAPRYAPAQLGLARALIGAGRPAEALDELSAMKGPLAKELDHHLLRTEALLGLGRTDEALRAGEEARRLAPDRPEVYALLGRIHTSRRDLPRAQAELAKALEVSPEYAPARFALGRLYRFQSKPDEALRHYDAIIARDPKNERAVVAKVETLVGQGRRDEAMRTVRTVAERDPRNPRWPTALGTLLASAGDLKQAEAEYRRALTLGEGYEPARFQLARLFVTQKHDAEAIGQLQRILERRPGNVLAATMLAALLAAQSRYEPAATVLEQALKAEPRAVGLAFQLAEMSIARGRHDEALALLRPLVAERPGLVEPRLLVALALLGRGSYAEALAELERVHAINPKLALAHYYTARAHVGRGDAVKARAEYRRALELAPGFERARIELAVLPGEGPATAQASVSALKAAVAKDPTNVASRSALASAYLAARQSASAEAEYREILKANPAFVPAHLGLAMLRTIDGNPDQALEHLNAIVRVNPGHVRARLMLADYFERQRNPELAVQQLVPVAQAMPQNTEIRLKLAAMLGDAGRFDEGIDYAKEVVAARPASAEAQYVLGDLLLRKGSLGEAATAFAAVLRLDPGHGGAHFGLGSVHEQRGDVDRALESYRRAMALLPGDPHPLNNAAWLLASRGTRLDEALRFARAANAALERRAGRERLPVYAAVLDTLGYVHYRRGEYAAAEPWLKQATGLAPGQAAYHLHLGLTYQRLGKGKDAANELEQALAKPGDLAAADIDEARRLLSQLGR